MNARRPSLFRKRKFDPVVIVTCVRWSCRFSLSLRDLEELMAERGLSVDKRHDWRWTQTYGPEVYRRLRAEVKRKSSVWPWMKPSSASPARGCICSVPSIVKASDAGTTDSSNCVGDSA